MKYHKAPHREGNSDLDNRSGTHNRDPAAENPGTRIFSRSDIVLGNQPHCITDYTRIPEQERVWALLYVRRIPLYVLWLPLGLH